MEENTPYRLDLMPRKRVWPASDSPLPQINNGPITVGLKPIPWSKKERGRCKELCRAPQRDNAAPRRKRDRWKTLISKLYAVLIRISPETARQRSCPQKYDSIFRSGFAPTYLQPLSDRK